MIAGLCIDGWLFVFGGNAPYESMAVRIIAFAAGELLTALAIAFVFRTSLPIQIYELLVREIADRFRLDVNRVKLINDLAMLALSAALSFLLTGGFHGFGAGTILITLVNAPLIALFGRLIDRFFTFEPRFPRFTALLRQQSGASDKVEKGEENG